MENYVTFRVDKVGAECPHGIFTVLKQTDSPVLVVLSVLLYTLLVLGRIVIGNYKGIPKRGVKAHRVQRRKLVKNFVFLVDVVRKNC